MPAISKLSSTKYLKTALRCLELEGWSEEECAEAADLLLENFASLDLEAVQGTIKEAVHEEDGNWMCDEIDVFTITRFVHHTHKREMPLSILATATLIAAFLAKGEFRKNYIATFRLAFQDKRHAYLTQIATQAAASQQTAAAAPPEPAADVSKRDQLKKKIDVDNLTDDQVDAMLSKIAADK